MLCNSSELVIELLLKVICLTETDRNRAVCPLRRFPRPSHHLQNDATRGRDRLQMWHANAGYLQTHQRPEMMRQSESSLQLWQPQKHGDGVRHPSVCGIQAFLNNRPC